MFTWIALALPFLAHTAGLITGLNQYETIVRWTSMTLFVCRVVPCLNCIVSIAAIIVYMSVRL